MFGIQRKLNTNRILTTGREFIPKRFVGPGTGKSVKQFKTLRGAEKAASRETSLGGCQVFPIVNDVCLWG